MDPDEIGGSCPRCDGEFQPGVTECPDCGIPLLGVGEAPPPAPRAPAPPGPGLPPAWADRLDVVAAACAVAVLLALFGSLVSALAFQIEDAIRSNVHQRLMVYSRIASVPLAAVALGGGAAAALSGTGRHLVRWLAFLAGALIAVTALIGGFETWYAEDGQSGAMAVYEYSAWVAAVVLGAVGAAVADVFPRSGSAR